MTGLMHKRSIVWDISFELQIVTNCLLATSRAKMKFPICPVYPTVEYRAKCHTYLVQDRWKAVKEMSNFMYTEQVGNFIFHPVSLLHLYPVTCESGIFMVVEQKYAGVCSLSLFPSSLQTKLSGKDWE